MSGGAGRLLARALAGLAMLALAPSGAVALETSGRLGPVSVRVVLEPDAPVIGDALQLEIEAVAESGVEVLMPDFGEALDRFRIVDFVPRERIDDEGRSVHVQRYTLRAPASGEHLLPGLLIEFVDRRPGHDPAPEGQDAYELLSEPIAFSVASLVPDGASADLHPPLGRLDPRDAAALRLWPWLLALAVVLLAASPFLQRALRRWSERAAVRSAFELARSELDALLAGPRPTPEKVDAFFVELSGIVRRYIERRFALPSLELTTERFLDLVSGSPDLTQAHQHLLRDFLRQSDLVKFAHHIPSREAIESAISAAGRFIEDTRDDLAGAGGRPAASET